LFVKENGKRKALSRACAWAVHQAAGGIKNGLVRGACVYAERHWWALGPILPFAARPFSYKPLQQKISSASFLIL